MGRTGRIAGLAAMGATAWGGHRLWAAGRLPERVPVPPGGWANWSRNQRVMPTGVVMPGCIDALVDLVAAGSDPLRPVGAGHSFTPLVVTDGTVVSLANLTGVVEVDRDDRTAWVRAGTSLRDLSRELAIHDLAMPNLGDIDSQSIAGAVATATHGTGAGLPCLSGQVIGVRLLTADGQVREATLDDDADLVRAAQVSLGALGILVEVKLALRDTFRLRRRVWVADIGDALATAHDRWAAHRHFEFFVLPFTGKALCITHDETDLPSTPPVESTDDEDLMNLKRLRDALWRTPAARKRLADVVLSLIPLDEDVVGASHDVLPTQRGVFFNELEYHVPVEAGLAALQEVLGWIHAHRPDVWFPIECRQTAGDRAWMSPFNDGNRISIAVHAAHDEDHSWFTGVESILARHGGRPHWGKLHGLDAADVRTLYLRAGDFTGLRAELDPAGRFLNPHLARLLGVGPRRGQWFGSGLGSGAGVGSGAGQ